MKTAMVEVFINQENFQFPESGTLADVLPLLRIEKPDGIAIAVNNMVIPSSEWNDYTLQAQDKIFVIRATQGG